MTLAVHATHNAAISYNFDARVNELIDAAEFNDIDTLYRAAVEADSNGFDFDAVVEVCSHFDIELDLSDPDFDIVEAIEAAV